MKLGTFGIDDSAAERDIGGGEIALERVGLHAFLQTDVEYTLSVATRRSAPMRNPAYRPAR